MKPIHFCLPTYNQPTLLCRAVEAALKSDIELADITIVDLSPEHYAAERVRYYDVPRPGFIRVITMPENIGLPNTLNLFFALYNDYIICSNDDVIIEPHTIRSMVEAAETHAGINMFFGAKDAFSFFLLRKHTYLQVGPFDPAFSPIYWDDVDWARRAELLGLYQMMVVSEATFEHIGSATLKSLDQNNHNSRFTRNERYYFAKWGGLRGDETFKIPFDGGVPWVPPFVP